MSSVVAMQKARQQGFQEILFLDRSRKILEGSTCNFAIIKGKELISPANGVLGGITMDLGLKLAAKMGFKVTRRSVSVTELRQADEAFITSTNREIVPVVKVDSIRIGSGKPGIITKSLARHFSEFAKQNTKISK